MASVDQMHARQSSLVAENRRPFSPRADERNRAKRNVGDTERQVSVAAGALLAAYGLARRDLSGLLLAGAGAGFLYRGASGHCSIYKALDITTADQSTRQTSRKLNRGIEVTQTFLIDKSPEELYAFWRKLDNLPSIMTHLKTVQTLDDRRSHWVAEAPSIAGGSVAWDAEIIEDVPNSRISWRSLPGGDIDNRGSVEFTKAPGTRGTVVRASLKYLPPAGQLGRWVAKLFGEDPHSVIREDLRNFKRQMEIGEVLTTYGQPRGACFAGVGRMMH